MNKSERRKKRRLQIKEFIIKYKESNPCIDCKKFYPARVMDFDHVSGNKTAAVSRIARDYSLDRVKEEINKCVLRCGNCHRFVTAQRKEMPRIIKNVNKKYYIFREIILGFKTQPCADCNNYFNVFQMEYDHLPQYEKLYDISKVGERTNYSIEKLLNEIKKCDTVCTNCHRIRTWISRKNKLQQIVPEWIYVYIELWAKEQFIKLSQQNPIKYKHGHSRNRNRHGSKVYRIWEHLKAICYNTNNKSYKNFGGKGIKMCDEWINSFEKFYICIGEPPDNKSLQRIDVNKNFEPLNVYWR